MTHTSDFVKHTQTGTGGRSRLAGRPRDYCHHHSHPMNQMMQIGSFNQRSFFQPHKRFWLKREHRKIRQSKACYAAVQVKNRRIAAKKNGFTLIEATVVLFIIGLLMLLILPNLTQQRDKAQQTHAKAMVATVQTQVDLYVNDHPEKKQVTMDDLAKENYLTKEQLEKVKALKIVIAGHEAKI